MPKRKLRTFRRDLDEQTEPSDHQRNFLYLPWEILRDYTNIRSIVVKYARQKDKPLKEIQINRTIKKYHSEMDKLDRWNEMHLDELDFLEPVDGAKRV